MKWLYIPILSPKFYNSNKSSILSNLSVAKEALINNFVLKCLFKMSFYEDIIALDGETKCILCKIFIPDNNQCIENHIKEDNHKQLFYKRLILQNNINSKGSQFFCRLCDRGLSDILDVISHIQETQHTSRLNSITEIVEKDGNYIELPCSIMNDEGTALCVLCNLHIDFTVPSITEHINAQKHKRARSIIVQPLNGIFTVEDSEDDLFCKMCQVYFKNYVELILAHVDEDKAHKENFRKILGLIDGQNITIDKFLTDPKEDKAWCHKCDTGLACNILNLDTHVRGKKHTS